MSDASEHGHDEAVDLQPASTRRGLFAAFAAVAAFAGFGATRARASTNTSVVGASDALYGLLSSPGTNAPLLPVLNGTSHGVIGSNSLATSVPFGSGILGVRNGSSLAGVEGVNGSNGFGVFGSSIGGVGVSGQDADTGIGVSGQSKSATGTLGKSTTGQGVEGQSDSGMGVRGVSLASYGVRGESTRGIGVFGGTQRANTPAVMARSYSRDRPLAGRFLGAVRVEGDFAVTGAKAAAVRMPDGTLATMYCQEAPEPLFEDFGRARLENGAARVAIDPDFAALVKIEGLMVFLTPEGDSEGLYVHARNAEGFDVRESRGGTSTLDFSWRIVAKRGDIAGERLARLDALDDVDVAGGEPSPDAASVLAAAMTRTPDRAEV